MPGFYKIKGLIFKKALQTVNIYPSTKGTLGFLENYDEFESIPAYHEDDEYHRLDGAGELTTPVQIGEVRSRDTKDAYINNKLKIKLLSITTICSHTINCSIITT